MIVYITNLDTVCKSVTRNLPYLREYNLSETDKELFLKSAKLTLKLPGNHIAIQTEDQQILSIQLMQVQDAS